MKVADLFARLGLRTDKGSFKTGDRLLDGIKKAVIGLGAFLSVRYFTGLIRDTARTADEFAKMSKKIGISVKDLRGLEFAAQIGGANIAQVRVGLQRFARVASDSQRGLKTARDAMKDANVQWRDGAGGLRDVDAMLLDVADKFASMPDGTKKTALAMELFGRSGAELIPLLNEGAAGIEKLRKEFDELDGGALAESSAAFEEFNDDQLRVKVALQGLRNEMVIALLPTLKQGVKNILAWVKANRAMLRQRVRKFAIALGKALVKLAKAALQVGKLIAWMIKNWKILSLLLLPLALAFGKIKLAMLGVAAALTFFFDALGRPPDMGLFEAISGTISEMGNMFKELGQGIVDFFGGIADGIREAFDVVFGWIGRQIERVMRAAKLAADFARDPTGSNIGKADRSIFIDRQLRGGARRLTREANRAIQNQNSTEVKADITVNVPPGANAEEAGQAFRQQWEDWFDSKMRTGAAAAGG